MKKIKMLNLLMAGWVFYAQHALCDVDMKLYGTLIEPPPCVINNDKPIEVDFGEVMTTRVDGNNYKTLINYSLTCTRPKSNALSLTISGSAASFSTTALKTNKTGLGVRILVGNTPYTINSSLKFTNPNKPTLYAVPVQQNGVSLTEGEFSSTATIGVAYQ